MAGPGRDVSQALPEGRVLEYWDGGDPTGRPAIMHPGTPQTRVMGAWGHRWAVSAGVRLISLNRPGYGGSTPRSSASLARIGKDTATLAAAIGLDEYAVFGVSGGGPFAVATAVADPGHVRALGVVGGIGPWRILDGPSRDPEGDACLTLFDRGDVPEAWDCMRRDVEQVYAGRAALDDDALADAMLTELGGGSPLSVDAAYRALWAANMRVVLETIDGVIFDNLAWGIDWDVDPGDVVAPTLVWSGELDELCPPAHGRWYADRIPDAELVIFPAGAHLDVIDGHWPEVLAGLQRIWR